MDALQDVWHHHLTEVLQLIGINLSARDDNEYRLKRRSASLLHGLIRKRKKCENIPQDKLKTAEVLVQLLTKVRCGLIFHPNN